MESLDESSTETQEKSISKSQEKPQNNICDINDGTQDDISEGMP